jgi:hypothetical protein
MMRALPATKRNGLKQARGQQQKHSIISEGSILIEPYVADKVSYRAITDCTER